MRYLLLLSACLFWVSCGSSFDRTLIHGSWKVVALETQEPGLQSLRDATFQFSPENTFQIIAQGKSIIEGDYHFNGNSLVLTKSVGNFNWPMSVEQLDKEHLHLNLHLAGAKAPIKLIREVEH